MASASRWDEFPPPSSSSRLDVPLFGTGAILLCCWALAFCFWPCWLFSWPQQRKRLSEEQLRKASFHRSEPCKTDLGLARIAFRWECMKQRPKRHGWRSHWTRKRKCLIVRFLIWPRPFGARCASSSKDLTNYNTFFSCSRAPPSAHLDESYPLYLGEKCSFFNYEMSQVCRRLGACRPARVSCMCNIGNFNWETICFIFP